MHTQFILLQSLCPHCSLRLAGFPLIPPPQLRQRFLGEPSLGAAGTIICPCVPSFHSTSPPTSTASRCSLFLWFLCAIICLPPIQVDISLEQRTNLSWSLLSPQQESPLRPYRPRPTQLWGHTRMGKAPPSVCNRPQGLAPSSTQKVLIE